MLNLDAHLISFLLAINALVIAVAILIAARSYPRAISRSMQIFSFGKLMIAASFVLVAARGTLPGLLTIVLANGLGVAGFYTNYTAARELQGKSHGLRLGAAILALVLLGTAYFTLLHSDLMGVRLVVGAAIVGILALLSFEMLACYRLAGSAHFIIGVTSLFMASAFLARFAISLAAMLHLVSNSADEWIEKGFMLALYVGATLAAVAFVLMCNDALNSELRRLVSIDPLSDLANRRKLFERGIEEVNRAERFHHPLAVLLVDIDHFKRINDSWGHATGDMVIRRIAQTLTAMVREVDLVARLGGEEFAILLPETDQATALEVAERLRQAAEAMTIERDRAEPLRITASIGIASLVKGASFDDLLNNADAAMYEAKKAGRNRVCIAPDIAPDIALVGATP